MRLSIRKAGKPSTAESNEVSTAGKKVKGRKRHIGVDIEGHLLHVEVTAAHVHDTAMRGYGIESMVMKSPTMQAVSADAGYRGHPGNYSEIWLDTPVQIATKSKRTFTILPKRWIVERTLAWMNNDRRLSKDYEVNPKYSENRIRVSLLKRTFRRFCSNS